MPHVPLAGQFSVAVDRVEPPVTDSDRVVAVWPLLVKVTEPEAAVGVVVVAEMLAGLALMLGALSPVPVTVR